MTGYLRRLIAAATREAGAIHPVLPSLYGDGAVHSAVRPDLAADVTVPAARDPPGQPHPFPEPNPPSLPLAVAGRDFAADATTPAVRDPPRPSHLFPETSSPPPPPAAAGPLLPRAPVVTMPPLTLEPEQTTLPAQSSDSIAPGDRLSQPASEQTATAQSSHSPAAGDRHSLSAPERPAPSAKRDDLPVAGDRPSAVVRPNREVAVADEARQPAADFRFVAPARSPIEPASSRQADAHLPELPSAAIRTAPVVAADAPRLPRADPGMPDRPPVAARRPRDRSPETDDVQIHIGRIEVTAIQPAAPRPPRAEPARRALSLDEYLKRRGGRAS
jgi:hypothetical protein